MKFYFLFVKKRINGVFEHKLPYEQSILVLFCEEFASETTLDCTFKIFMGEITTAFGVGQFGDEMNPSNFH